MGSLPLDSMGPLSRVGTGSALHLELSTHGPAGGLAFVELVSEGLVCGGLVSQGLVVSVTRFGRLLRTHLLRG